MKRKTCICGFALLLVACVLTGCAAGPNVLKDSPNSDGDLAGFWLGLWHGMILPLAFVISLFTANVSIYEVHNSGALYNFGFLLGAGMVWGGGGATARHRVARESEDERQETIGTMKRLDDLGDEEEDDLEEVDSEEQLDIEPEPRPQTDERLQINIPDQSWNDQSWTDSSSNIAAPTPKQSEDADKALHEWKSKKCEHEEAVMKSEAEKRERDEARQQEAREFLGREAERLQQEREDREAREKKKE